MDMVVMASSEGALPCRENRIQVGGKLLRRRRCTKLHQHVEFKRDRAVTEECIKRKCKARALEVNGQVGDPGNKAQVERTAGGGAGLGSTDQVSTGSNSSQRTARIQRRPAAVEAGLITVAVIFNKTEVLHLSLQLSKASVMYLAPHHPCHMTST